MTNVRIAAVSYLNTRPLIEGIDKLRGVEVEPVVPSQIGDRLLAGSADLGLASVFDIITSGERLSALPVGMIGCDGPTLTVKMLLSGARSGINEIHADTESRTSVRLAQLLVRGWSGALPSVTPLGAESISGLDEANRSKPACVLLIGDKVVRSPTAAWGYETAVDLGSQWHETTGLPFVYACWACRTEDAARSDIRVAADMLDRQRRRNAMRIDAIAGRAAEQHGWTPSLARRYLGSLMRYEVTDGARRGVDRFVAMLDESGLAPGGSVRWADGAVGAAAAERV